MNGPGAVVLAVGIMLHWRAAAFLLLLSGRISTRAFTAGGVSKLGLGGGAYRHIVRRQATESGAVDGTLPGAADARLAGWRVAKAAEAPPPTDVGGGSPDSNQVACGDVVEYPLSQRAKEDAGDGRERGVGVVVSINRERGDAWQLPEDLLDRCELQVLCPDLDAESPGVWLADELETCAFAEISELTKVKAEFNQALDKWKRWTLLDDLSEGCGARDAEWDYDDNVL